MKKIISLLITAAMLLALGATLASCAHECTFSDEWSKDATAHWHVCENEKCEEIADKADHNHALQTDATDVNQRTEYGLIHMMLLHTACKPARKQGN